MGRADEVVQIDPNMRHVWLASQIDEVERDVLGRLDGLGAKMDHLGAELVMTREQMSHNTTRMLVAITTASITLLISVIAWIATIVIKP